MASALVSAIEYPGDRCCTFYRDAFFSGDHKTYCLKDSDEDRDFDIYPLKYKVSAVFCGKETDFALKDWRKDVKI